jgi:hypothetical protein
MKHTLCVACAALFLALGSACGSSSNNNADSGGGQDATADAGVTDTGPDCVMNPGNTHSDIINACTTAQHYDKKPTLPLLYADGGLPAIP